MLKNRKSTLKVFKRKVYRGFVYIKLGFNNTIVSVTDTKGNVISSASAGFCGFKGSKKGTPFAAQISTEYAAKKALEYGFKQAEVVVRGPGAGREMALRVIQNLGIGIISIKDVTPLPHNGCRPSKKRRV